MIPKIIHYCWFGGGEYTEKVKKCINSWFTVLPDYEIRLWNEDNVDLDEAPYIREAYNTRHFSFVSDFVRMKVMEEYGGIYLDVDMEVKKRLDNFLKFSLCLGTDDEGHIETVMMAEPHHPILKQAFESYKNRKFTLSDGSYNLEVPNILFDRLLKPLGFNCKNTRQSLDGNIEIFPDEYFQGISLVSGKPHMTENTYIVHWHTLLWVSWRTRLIRFIRMKILVPLLGKSLYLKITSLIKK